MKKTTSLRRAKLKSQNVLIENHIVEQSVTNEKKVTQDIDLTDCTVSLKKNELEEFIQTVLTNQKDSVNKFSNLLSDNNEALVKFFNDKLRNLTKENKALLKEVVGLNSEILGLKSNLSIIISDINEIKKNDISSSITKNIAIELQRMQHHLISQFKLNLKQELNFLKNILITQDSDVKTERTISFQLGKTLIDSKKSIENLVNLPNKLLGLKNEAKQRSLKLKTISQDLPIDHGEKNKSEIVSKKTIVINEGDKIENKNDLNTDFPLISYDFIKKHWPSTNSKARFISILDEISENSWGNEFKLYPLNKSNYTQQIEKSTSNALFIESCWKGNNGSWEYAFTSPGLKHSNAQKLLDALEIAKRKGMPIIFWNKEDPMHYEKFLPVAEKCDIIFTTDENKVKDYKRDLPGKKVYPLVFAANPFICNPVNRSRYEQETICFAGSYYSVGHDDRKVQMDTLLPALLEFNGAIYDRMSALNNERYFFPEQYRHLIRDGVDFKTMSVLYKRFKIFLNVNTITDSPTMMSRRVYELLACGTPVISTPSLALEKQFPGIVQIANNAEDAVKIAKELLQDEWKYKHLAHRGYREVMLKHTYQHRVKDILNSIEVQYDDVPAKVSILMATMREHYVDRILENLGRQTYQNLELFIVTQGFSAQGIAKLKAGLDKIQNIKDYQVLEINTDMTLGERLNKAAALAKGEYLAKMDDDDFYFDNYLTDMVIPFSYGNFALVGKKEIFIYLESQNKTVMKYPQQSHRITDFVSGATLVVKKKVFDEVGGFNSLNKSEDSTLIEKIKALKLAIYAADPFNFMVWRSNDTSNHTWQVGDEEFLKNSVVFDGFDEAKVRI